MPKSDRSTPQPARSQHGGFAKLSLGLTALLMSVLVHAQSNPFERGPEPTVASLEAAAGPYAVQTTQVGKGNSNDYARGTVYYPVANDGQFALIAIVPGYTERQAGVSWWGSRLASHGFVVVTVDTNAPGEFPPSRARALKDALATVVKLSQTSSSPFFGKIDASRQGIMGHSMGGGATLELARSNSKLKAAIPFAPWNSNSKVYTRVKVPTLIISCQRDAVAPVNSHANKFYDSFSATLDKALLEVTGGDHYCASTSASAANKAVVGKYGVAWMKRFLDNDTRYSQFLCGAPHQADLAGPIISSYKDSCPY